MTPNLKISQYVVNRISHIRESCFGSLYGIIYGNSLFVVSFVVDSTDKSIDIQSSFPGEIDLCGLVGIGEAEFKSSRAQQLIEEVDVTDNPVFLSCKLGRSDITASFVVHEKLEETNYEVISDANIWSQFVHVRLQTRLPFISELQADSIRDNMRTLRKQLASGEAAFHFPKTSVYLMGSDSETGLTGLTGEPEVGELLNLSTSLSEGCTYSRSKKKLSSTDMEVLCVEMFRKATKDHLVESGRNHAAVIDVKKKAYECLSMPACIDALSMVHRSAKLVHLYEVLVESLCRNLRLIEHSLLLQLDQCRQGDKNISLPELFHVYIDDCGHFFTRVHTKSTPEETLEIERRKLHELLLLPVNRPYFRHSNAYVFKYEYPSNGPLVNPHESIVPNASGESEVAVIRGKSAYYHYMQEQFNDDGWGCAYRSLQTLCSWFRWQGYTDKPVPSHRDIQECLVRIGDKPADFIGSKQWIGSTEVSFCLESLLGIPSKIRHVSSGEDLGMLGPELLSHFRVQGTPVMIGGGVLAHTIIGVDYNELKGELRFLVLDPHYTGSEDLSIILSKGWCGWKTADFWNKKAYYNLCLPQVPQCI